MMILRQSRFLHVPKTGGTWCHEAIKKTCHNEVIGFEGNKRHLDLDRAPGNGLFTFAFVRNPLDWWKSYWKHRMRHGWTDTHNLDKCRSDSFCHFMENILDTYPGHFSHMIRKFVGPPKNPIDFIGKFERLSADLSQAMAEAGESYDRDRLIHIPPINVSPDGLTAEYSPQLLKDVERAEDEGIRRFAY